jgi:PKD domain
VGHRGKHDVVTAVAAVLAACALAAPAASAAGIHGVVPDLPTGATSPRAAQVISGASLDYGGGPVMHSNRTHVIFWNPSNKALTWDPGYQDLITGFLTNVAADSHKPTNVYGLTGQYNDGTGRAYYDSTYAGALQDTDGAPGNGCTLPSTGPTMPDGTTPWPVCLTQTQLETEVKAFIAAKNLPTGLADIYFLVTPDGFGSCVNAGPQDCSLGGASVMGSFCGFHTWINLSSPILYANMPYTAVPGHCASGSPRPNGSTADPTLSTISHEHNETITDPEGGTGWVDSMGNEDGDLCATRFGPVIGGSGSAVYNEVIGTGHYLLQEEWSNEDAAGSTDPSLGCVPGDERDPMSFSLPASIAPGATIALTGSATDPDGTITGYGWNFGDGSAIASGAAVSHAYAATGTYQVTLTASDVSGLNDTLTKTLVVDTAPVARISLRSARPAPLVPVTFDGSASSDSDGSIASYHWDFGDGSPAATTPVVRHTFFQGGSVTAQLTVTDNFGVSSTRSLTITLPPLPQIKASLKGRTLKIKLNEAGTLQLGAKRIRVAHAATVALKLALSTRQLHVLHVRHALKLRLKLVFAPRAGLAIVKTISITLRG